MFIRRNDQHVCLARVVNCPIGSVINRDGKAMELMMGYGPRRYRALDKTPWKLADHPRICSCYSLRGVCDADIGALCVHHVGILCDNLERSLDFYQNLLGLEINEARPHDKLPYRGAWLWVGSEMIHLMELPNPDPLTGRPEHGGRDRHTCITIKDVAKLKAILDNAGLPYTLSKSGRPAIFTRDPDANALEFVQLD